MVPNPPEQGNSSVAADAKSYELAQYLYHSPPPDGLDLPLSALFARERPWDTHRGATLAVQHLYALEREFERFSERMENCSGYLKFGFNETDGVVLKRAQFCRVRYCAVCQWRKTLLWKTLMFQTYDRVMQSYPTHRFVFLTLTVRNPPIGELRATLQHMNQSWHRLVKRKAFANVVQGWVRTTEVTRPKGDTANTHAHPHFHVILMVDPSYFGRNYVKHAAWAELWRDCLRVSYLPNVDVRAVKSKGGKDDPDGMRGAIAETLKYAVKPSDIIQDAHDPLAREWFFELTRQTHKLRFVASGGVLKDALKPDDAITDDDMVKTGNDDNTEDTDTRRLNFTFRPHMLGYAYDPTHNE